MEPPARFSAFSFKIRHLAALGGALTGALLAGCGGSAYRAGLAPDLDSGDLPNPVQVLRDQVYAVRDGEALRADVYRPRFGRFPGVVVIHPGGWVSGNKRDVARLARRAAERGYVAVAPRYRLAPRHQFPAQIHDLKEVVRWMRSRSSLLGVDPERIAALGYSAGGHLSALLATSGPEAGLEGPTAFPGVSSRVQAFVAGGTPSDLRALPPNPAVPRLLGASAKERPDLASAASPLTFVSADDPPGFLYHGRLDALIGVSQARRLVDSLRRVGVPAQLELARFGHFTTWLFGGRQERLAFDFLDRVIGGEARAVAQANGPEPS